MFRLFFRLFFGCLTGTHSAPSSAVFPAVFFNRAFGTSLHGHRDCKASGDFRKLVRLFGLGGAHFQGDTAHVLGGNFGPEKKIFSRPPPPKSPPGPSPPSPFLRVSLRGDPPPLGMFNIKKRTNPLFLACRTPLPLPRAEKE